MKIFLAAQQSPHVYPIAGYGFWAHYFRNGLQEAGHTVVEANGADWARGLLPLAPEDLKSWRSQVWGQTLRTVREEGAEMLLGYFFPQQVEPSAIRELQEHGVPCVNFFCDNVREYTKLPRDFSPFSLHWVPEVRALPLYIAAGWKHVWAPMPAWIPADLRTPTVDERFPPTFVGTRDALREDLLGRALSLGAAIEVRGTDWLESALSPRDTFKPAPWWTKTRRQLSLMGKDGWRAPLHKLSYRRPPSPYRELVRTHTKSRPANEREVFACLRESEVALGVNRFPSFRAPFEKPQVYSRLRDIEAPMSGACYLTEWTDDLPRLYELGEEIETYRTAEELVAKLGELQASPDRRRALRRRGQSRALNDHTIGRSLEKIIAALR